MARERSEMSLVIVFMVMLWGRAVAQSSCTTALMSMSSCLNYVTGSSSTPSSSCCSQLESVVKSEPRCLCSLLNGGGGGGGSSLGFTINQTLALELPGACKVQTPPASQCNSANGPADAPLPPTSPISSPPDPQNPTSPLPAIPSASGTISKTVPTTTDTHTSGGNEIESLFGITMISIFLNFFFGFNCHLILRCL